MLRALSHYIVVPGSGHTGSWKMLSLRASGVATVAQSLLFKARKIAGTFRPDTLWIMPMKFVASEMNNIRTTESRGPNKYDGKGKIRAKPQAMYTFLLENND